MSSGRILLSLGAAVFGLVALASGLDRISRRNPATERLVPAPFRAQADRSAAAAEISREAVPSAIAHARAAVKHDPVDPAPTALLGSALFLSGDEDGAAASFRVAARFGWRNVATQRYWFEAALQGRNYQVAVERADAILRAHPGFTGRDAMLEPLETDPAARRILVAQLARQPSWIKTYYPKRPDVPDAIMVRRAAVAALVGEAAPGQCELVKDFTVELLARGMRSAAERVWNANCPRMAVRTGLFDPRFDQVGHEQGNPFGWRVIRSGDVRVAAKKTPQGDNQLEMSNEASVSRKVLQQAVALPPGRYRFNALLADGGGDAPAPISASLQCGSAARLNEAGGSAGSAGQLLSIGDCSRQQLTLWLRPGARKVRLTSVELRRE